MLQPSYNIVIPLLDENGNVVSKQSIVLHDEMENNEPVGRFITRDAFVNLVHNNLKFTKEEEEQKIVAFKINRQILQLMLSFENCTHLAFCESKRPDGTDTLTVVALKANQNNDQVPIGWDPPVIGSNYDKDRFIAAEWIHGYTKADARDRFNRKANPESQEINLAEFFTNL